MLFVLLIANGLSLLFSQIGGGRKDSRLYNRILPFEFPRQEEGQDVLYQLYIAGNDGLRIFLLCGKS